jgi:hypothetical protein
LAPRGTRLCLLALANRRPVNNNAVGVSAARRLLHARWPNSLCSGSPGDLVTELSEYELSTLRDGAFMLSRDLRHGLAAILPGQKSAGSLRSRDNVTSPFSRLAPSTLW